MIVVKEDGYYKLFEGVSKDGRPYKFAKQDVMVHSDDGEVRKARIQVDPDKPRIAAGEYDVSGASIVVFTDQKNNDFLRVSTTPQLIRRTSAPLKAVG